MVREATIHLAVQWIRREAEGTHGLERERAAAKKAAEKAKADKARAAAKAAPGKYPYGSPGPGSALQIGMAAFDYRLDLKMKHIPFKGTSEIIQAMLAGTLNVTTGQPNSIDQYDLVPLAP